MTKAPEARKAAERRRRARRKAENRGQAPPEWAELRDPDDLSGTSTSPPARQAREDRTGQILRMGVARVAALALARQAEAAMMLPAIPPTDDANHAPRDDPRHDPGAEGLTARQHAPTPADDGREERVRRESLTRGREALRRVLAAPCPSHCAEAGEPCWTIAGTISVCRPRMLRAGFRPDPALPPRRDRPDKWITSREVARARGQRWSP